MPKHTSSSKEKIRRGIVGAAEGVGRARERAMKAREKKFETDFPKAAAARKRRRAASNPKK